MEFPAPFPVINNNCSFATEASRIILLRHGLRSQTPCTVSIWDAFSVMYPWGMWCWGRVLTIITLMFVSTEPCSSYHPQQRVPCIIPFPTRLFSLQLLFHRRRVLMECHTRFSCFLVYFYIKLFHNKKLKLVLN